LGFLDISGGVRWAFGGPTVVIVIAGGVSARGARILGLIGGLAGVRAGTLAAWGGGPEDTSADLSIALPSACVAFAGSYGLAAAAKDSLRASHDGDTSGSPPHRSAWAAARREEGSKTPDASAPDGLAPDPQAVDDAFGHVRDWYRRER
jgi:hypothetical protein